MQRLPGKGDLFHALSLRWVLAGCVLHGVMDQGSAKRMSRVHQRSDWLHSYLAVPQQPLSHGLYVC